jgi:hypothetical protein
MTGEGVTATDGGADADAPPAIDREAVAALALKQCGDWCRRVSGTPRWRQVAEPDWELLVSRAALRVVDHFSPHVPGGLPHRNFVAGCCRITLSDLTRTRRRRAAAGFDEPSLRVPLDPHAADPRQPEPWVGAAIRELGA